MNMKNTIRLVVFVALLTFDYIMDKIYESGKVIYDTKIALLQMNNSNIDYLSYSLYQHNNLYNGLMFLINLIILLILILTFIGGRKNDKSE